MKLIYAHRVGIGKGLIQPGAINPFLFGSLYTNECLISCKQLKYILTHHLTQEFNATDNSVS